MKLVVVTPHFAPDVAPTGHVVTRLVDELAARAHRIEVVTSLPWYRNHAIEPGYEGRLVRYEDTPWGRIARVHPFPTSDKRNLAGRAAAFAGFSAVAAAVGGRGGPVDGVLAVSPPLTLGLTGRAIAAARRAPLVFNVQDVYPDVVVKLGVLRGRSTIAAASILERLCYRWADAITVLSDDLKDNVAARVPEAGKVRVVPNFVDTTWIRPSPRENDYRGEFGLEGKFVVMYAGNVGFSQPLGMMLDAAAALSFEENVAFVINGQGAARAGLEERARGLDNVRFVDMQPSARLPEVLAAADVHLVLLRSGLSRSSVPSKTYSILAAGRPLIAAVDQGSEVARLVERSGAGLAVAPEDAEALTKAVRRLHDLPEEAAAMGKSGARYIAGWASPAAVAEAYEQLFLELRRR